VGVGDVQVMSSQSQRTGGVSMYWCYYFGGDNTRRGDGDDGPKGSNMAIGLAMSSDGRHWGRVEGEHPNGAILQSCEESETDSQFVGWPQVLMRAAEDYLLYYHTIDPATGRFLVGVARGKDGVKFTKVGPVLQAGPPGSFDAGGASARHVIELDEAEGQEAKARGKKGGTKYLMFYEAIDEAGRHSIGLAESADGLSWKRSGDRPVFEPSADSQAWDAGAVGRPNVVQLDDGRYRLYYYGQSGKGAGREQERSGIGMAECHGSDWWSWERTAPPPDPHA
jgi:predicted GH43/DUF377 family glycosyl hydrolase